MNFIKNAKKFALDVLFPKFCFGCAKEGVFLCAPCEKDINDTINVQKCPVCSLRNFSGLVCPPCKKYTNLSRFLFAHSYKNPLARELIHAFKYQGIIELAQPLAGLMVRTVKNFEVPLRKTMLMAPIPLHPARLRSRGFNQSEMLASILAKEFELELVADNLFRRVHTSPQVECTGFKERRKNIEKAFAVKNPSALGGKRVLLIDDVSTSRATLDEAAGVLKEAGAISVWGIVVARG